MPIHLGVITHLPAAKIGLNGPRRDDVHRYPPSAQLFRLIAGQDLHRPLHRGVGRIARQGKARQAAGNVEDAPPVLQEGQQPLGQEKRAFELDVHQLVKLRFAGLGEGDVEADPGVVQ